MEHEESLSPPLIRLAEPRDIAVIEELDRLSTSPTRDIHRDMEKYFGSVDPSTHELTLIFLVQFDTAFAGKAELMVPSLPVNAASEGQEIHVTRVGYVKRVIIHPQYRKHGLARLLMQHIITYARRELHLSAIDLHVWEGNQPAIRLYETLGFELQHRELYFRLDLEVLPS